ncbi:MFS general substrate transporter [Pseudohyphozyma bogoriensis]|nr:MFS general substrate transporter [Pseudohyphozyma bogoriensis]
MLTMCSTFASAIFSSAIEETSQIYGVSTEVMTLGTSLFIAGYIPGPIVFAPISEMKCCCAVIPGCRGRTYALTVIGAAVSQSYLGWRWTEYLVTILTGTVTNMNQLHARFVYSQELTLPIRMVVLEPMVLCLTLYNATPTEYSTSSSAPSRSSFRTTKDGTRSKPPSLSWASLVGTLSAAGLNLMYSIVFFAPYVDSHNGVAKPG